MRAGDRPLARGAAAALAAALLIATRSIGAQAPPPVLPPPPEQRCVIASIASNVSGAPEPPLVVQDNPASAPVTPAWGPLTPDARQWLSSNHAAFQSSENVLSPTVQGRVQDEVGREIHHVTTLQGRRAELDGRGVRVAIMDMGSVMANHPQFATPSGAFRVESHSQDAASVPDQHATHVAGTVASGGLPSPASIALTLPADPRYAGRTPGEASKGMAPAATILSYSARDCSYDAAIANADISNFSIVLGTGWERIGDPGFYEWMGPEHGDDPHFGRYDVMPQFIDALVAGRPEHLVVAAAGNDRVDYQSPSQGISHRHADGTLYVHDDVHPVDTRKGGFDTVHSWCVGKNVLCVGSIDDAPRGVTSSSSSIFSSWGPTDDGRVKPDVVANGDTVVSLALEPQLYAFGSGTSSAAPAAAGIASLILEEMRLKSIPVTAALLKAVMIHSAADVAPDGPDPKFGFGVLNADAAVDLLSSAVMRQTVVVTAAQPPTFCFNGNLAARPKVTAVWTDLPGPIRTGLDERTPVLVNDIDVELTDPGGTIRRPWVLAGNTAVRQANHVDTVEVVEAATGTIGKWRLTLRLSRAGTGVTEVPVAVIVSGLLASTC